MNIAKLGQYSLYEDGNKHRLVVYTPRLAGKINRLFYRVDESVRFCEGDEVLFVVPNEKLAQVQAVLGIKNA
jgi:hypothetical protein